VRAPPASLRADPSVAGVVASLRDAVAGALRGKEEVVELALACILAGGHLLLQDVPGVGKTTLAQALARSLGGTFIRVQFTSDLLPADLTGTNVLDRETGAFRFRRGPLFANVVLADEINRTTPKTQSALFEAMEEGQISVDGQSHLLPRPFFVVATQNPFDWHGTFQLPESQLDRFLMRLGIGYPDRGTEREILRAVSTVDRVVTGPILDPAAVEALLREASAVVVPELVEEYLLDVVRGTRTDARFLRGVSTRGAQALHRAVRAWALLHGRRVALPEDVRALAVPVLAHRILPRSASAGTADVDAVRALVDELPPPL
jgi:MoxR-like ATPase